MNTTVLTRRAEGLYCPPGDFFIDPWKPVGRAVITHAHADHARRGSSRYLAAAAGKHVLRLRLGDDADIQFVGYGQPLTVGSVRLSLHPAGHMLGSSQVRLEHGGFVCVVSGDYKRSRDATATEFETLPCHQFVTESTFGLPIFRWPDPDSVVDEIHGWWKRNQETGRASMLYAYAIGKSQRILANLDPELGPILAHGAVQRGCQAYRADGISLPDTRLAVDVDSSVDWSRALILAPPSAHGTPWTRRFRRLATAMASGWMRIRGFRRRRAIDRGFVLSDHADWPDLLRTIHETRAASVQVTHGMSAPLARYLVERGQSAEVWQTDLAGKTDTAEMD